MLIPDLLNTLFDQSDFSTIVMLASLNKRKNNYANKYSLLQYYNNACVRAMTTVMSKFKTTRFVCVAGQLKALKHIVECLNFDASHGFEFRICAESGYFEMVKYLAGYSAVPYFTISACAKRGDLVMVKYLISIGACVNEGNHLPLRQSAQYGHIGVVKWLVKCGAEVKQMRSYGALYEAGNNGHLGIVKYLIENGANCECIHELFGRLIKGDDVMMVKYLVSVGIHCDMLLHLYAVTNIDIAEYLASIDSKTKS